VTDHRIRGKVRFVKNRFSYFLGRSTIEAIYLLQSLRENVPKYKEKGLWFLLSLEICMTKHQEKCCGEI